MYLELFLCFFPKVLAFARLPCARSNYYYIIDCKMAASDNTWDSVRRIQSVTQTTIDNIDKHLSLVEQRGIANPEATQSGRSSIEPERSPDTTIASRSIN